MRQGSFSSACAAIETLELTRIWGRVAAVDGAAVRVSGLSGLARAGDRVAIESDGAELRGEIVALGPQGATAMLYGPADGLVEGARARLTPGDAPRPGAGWLGRVVNAFGRCADGSTPPQGDAPVRLRAAPPPAALRRPLGPRLETGFDVFNTALPLRRGQRLGVFAGSGVGKSTLLAGLAKGVDADVAVIGLIGERGREVRDFVEDALGPEGMARSVVVVATSDEPAPVKRRAAWMTMALAEHFRDQGKHVLCLFDSLTRFAESHREVALTAGEAPSLRAFPPSTVNMIAALAERAGPGAVGGEGDITAVFTVLVAGGDMDEPVADMSRGILDGHVILEREIAERGRFPAVNLRRSVSRSLPGAASPAENVLIGEARKLISTYEDAAPMIHLGLYKAGADPQIDRAVRLWPALDAFVGGAERDGVAASFARLSAILASGSEEGGEGASEQGDDEIGAPAA